MTNTEEYRLKVFELLTNLEVLDGFDRRDREAEDDEEEDYGESYYTDFPM